MVATIHLNLFITVLPSADADNVMPALWPYHGWTQEPRPQFPVTIPRALARFPGEFYPLPSRSLAERAFNVVRWSEMAAGGHFAAMEEPEAFACEVIEFLASQS